MRKDDGNDRASEASAESSFSSYADPLVHEALQQAAALEGSAEAEQLHKLRVALRQLRTLLWAYGPTLDKDFASQQRALLKFCASAAGSTRDWDIVIDLVGESGGSALVDAFRRNRTEASETSRETLSNANLKKVLREAIAEVNRELNTQASRTPLTQFARHRVTAAEKQLKKRIRVAMKSGTSDYACFHEVRKAGKKVRYLIEFFDPLLAKKQRKGHKHLKRLQKRLGSLNDVVASRHLLKTHRATLPDSEAIDQALRSLKKEQKRRMKAASALL